MLHVRLSRLAEEILCQTIQASRVPTGKGLRLEKCKGGLTLSIDRPHECDLIAKKSNRIILIIANELDKQIGKATIDIINIEKNPKLVIIKHKKGGDAYSKAMLEK